MALGFDRSMDVAGLETELGGIRRVRARLDGHEARLLDLGYDVDFGRQATKRNCAGRLAAAPAPQSTNNSAGVSSRVLIR